MHIRERLKNTEDPVNSKCLVDIATFCLRADLKCTTLKCTTNTNVRNTLRSTEVQSTEAFSWTPGCCGETLATWQEVQVTWQEGTEVTMETKLTSSAPKTQTITITVRSFRLLLGLLNYVCEGQKWLHMSPKCLLKTLDREIIFTPNFLFGVFSNKTYENIRTIKRMVK